MFADKIVNLPTTSGSNSALAAWFVSVLVAIEIKDSWNSSVCCKLLSDTSLLRFLLLSSARFSLLIANLFARSSCSSLITDVEKKVWLTE